MNPATPCILHRWECESTSLADALANFGPPGGSAIVLLSDPHAFRVGILKEGSVRHDGVAVLDLAHVFEARCFHKDAELRWRQDAAQPGAVGRAVVLAEQAELNLPDPWKKGESIIEAIDRIKCTYVLRRGVVPSAMAEPESGLMQLEGYEYVAEDPDHGNAFVVAERLVATVPDVLQPKRQ